VQWLAQEGARRQELYKEFIEEAAKCYVDALQHDEPDISAPVGLYARLGRMRVLASNEVIAHASEITREILDTYSEPDKSFAELRQMAKSGSFDLLYEFSEACRVDLDSLRAQ